jgi:OmpA-OmpF porin, OOP family
VRPFACFFQYRRKRATFGLVIAQHDIRSVTKRLASLVSVGLLAMCSGAIALAVAPKTANAQSEGFYLDRAQLSGAPDDPFMTWRPFFHDKPRFYGSATLGYALNPLRIQTVSDRQQVIDDYGNPYSNQVFVYLNAGLQLNRRIAFDIAVPFAPVSVGGDDPTADGIGYGFDRGPSMYDARLALRAMAIESDDRTFRWGAGGAVFIPTGTESRFSSDTETTVWLFTNAEYHGDGFMWVGMVGPHFRPKREISPSTLQVGNEVRLSTGLFFPLDDRFTLGAEIWGQFGVHDVEVTEVGRERTESGFLRGANTPFEWLAQGRWAMGAEKSWYLMAGAGTRFTPGYGAADLRVLAQIGSHLLISDIGPDDKPQRKKSIDKVDLGPDPDMDGDGFPDAIDQCPTIKEDGKPPYPDDGCPDLDKDDDGILDKDDKCPTVPEDKDGIEDEDGCPEDDADKDGILDAEDACPEVKGVKSDDPKKNGCPEEKKKRIVVTRSEIQLLEPIQFAYNDSAILPVSFPLLDEVVQLMVERPMVKLGIYGHTDNRGGAAYNKRLSDRRAAAVVKYIVDKGVSSDRLESAGFGLEQPLTENNTEEGRSKNRRVEFKILAQ